LDFVIASLGLQMLQFTAFVLEFSLQLICLLLLKSLSLLFAVTLVVDLVGVDQMNLVVDSREYQSLVAVMSTDQDFSDVLRALNRGKLVS